MEYVFWTAVNKTFFNTIMSRFARIVIESCRWSLPSPLPLLWKTLEKWLIDHRYTEEPGYQILKNRTLALYEAQALAFFRRDPDLVGATVRAFRFLLEVCSLCFKVVQAARHSSALVKFFWGAVSYSLIRKMPQSYPIDKLFRMMWSSEAHSKWQVPDCG